MIGTYRDVSCTVFALSGYLAVQARLLAAPMYKFSPTNKQFYGASSRQEFEQGPRFPCGFASWRHKTDRVICHVAAIYDPRHDSSAVEAVLKEHWPPMYDTYKDAVPLLHKAIRHSGSDLVQVHTAIRAPRDADPR